jgi:hypothetical protein
MHNLYARIVLWLIRPALECHNSMEIRTGADLRPGGNEEIRIVVCDAAAQKQFFESAIGGRGSPAWKTSSPNDRRRRK